MIKERYSGRVKPESICLDPDEVVVLKEDFLKILELAQLGYRAYHLIDFARITSKTSVSLDGYNQWLKDFKILEESLLLGAGSNRVAE